MSDEKKKELQELLADGVEISDEELEGVAGGFIYHDKGDFAAHRRESFYVVDDHGEVVMRLDSMQAAERWAGNLRTSAKALSAEEFEKMRRRS